MTQALTLLKSGQLRQRAEIARRMLARCVLCPRRCRVNRLKGETGVCATGGLARIASYGPHFGEEQPLVGTQGSGTIFLAGCSLRCCFCQNYDISQGDEPGQEVDAREFAAIMLELQAMGCHNINLVTPSHVVPQILAALIPALEGGLRIPLVFNCSGYESIAALALLDGVVDIYLADFKFWQPATAARYAEAPDYPDRAREALLLMQGQVGDLVIGPDGCARSGLLDPSPADAGAARSNRSHSPLHRHPSLQRYLCQPHGPVSSLRHCRSVRGTAADRHGDEYRWALEMAHTLGLTRIDRPDLARMLRRLDS
jgi:putative pyruvate formate lyase activating enzyme